MPDAIPSITDDALDEINRLWTIARTYSNTAHDVNNALQVISGSAELLLSRDDLDERTARRLSAVRAQAGRAATMIGSLLAYVRGVDEVADRVDLGALVDAAVAMRSASLGRAEIQLSVTRSPTAPCVVRAQPQRTLQLLLNLLLIAEARVPAGPGRIVVRLDGEAGLVRVTLASSAIDGEARADGGPRRTPAAPLFPDSQVGVVRRLAAAQQGEVSMPAADDPAGLVTLTLPAAS